LCEDFEKEEIGRWIFGLQRRKCTM